MSGRRRALLVVLVLGAIAASGLVVLHSPLVSMRSVVLVGATHERRTAVLRAANLLGHPPLIDVDAATAAAGIERLPWVNDATVTRAWPSAVRIVVTERRPIGAAMLGRSRYALVDRTGRVLGIVAAPPGGLVALVGLVDLPPPGRTLSEPGRALLSVAAALPVALLSRVVSFATGTEGVVATLAHGPLVVFGSPNAIGAKYVALATLLREEPTAIASAKVLDLRVPEAPVLTP